MSFFEANIWKSSIFKNLGFLLSTPKKIQPSIFISEAGIISMEKMPMSTGYCYSDAQKVAYVVIQKAKIAVQGLDHLCLLISERSYLPLDPLRRIGEEEKAKIEPLKNIAKAKHDEAFSGVMMDNRKSTNAELLKTLFYVLAVIMTIALIIYLIKSR